MTEKDVLTLKIIF